MLFIKCDKDKKFHATYRQWSISKSLWVMKLFSSTELTLTNAAPKPCRKNIENS